jgi:hypothetical protein
MTPRSSIGIASADCQPQLVDPPAAAMLSFPRTRLIGTAVLAGTAVADGFSLSRADGYPADDWYAEDPTTIVPQSLPGM